MKKGFTLIEAIFIVIIVTILSAAFMGKESNGYTPQSTGKITEKGKGTDTQENTTEQW